MHAVDNLVLKIARSSLLDGILISKPLIIRQWFVSRHKNGLKRGEWNV